VIDRRLITNFDWTLLGLVVAICLVGVLNIYSASFVYQVEGAPYYLKQLNWMFFGVLLSLFVASFDYHILEDFSYGLYGVFIVLLLLVLLVGKKSLGATRWLNLGLFTMQPSELLKIVIVLAFAKFYNNYHAVNGLTLKDLMIPLLLLGAPVAMIMKQPDLGTAVLVCMIAFTMSLFIGFRWRTVVTFVLVTVPAGWLIWSNYMKPYQKNRILDFINPERSRLGSGYHIIQSKIAVGSGGWFGKGFVKGTQSQLRFLPEQHTDFAFSVFCEEWGFVGAFVLLALMLSLIVWGLTIARTCNDRFGGLLAVGITAMLFWHTVINIGMVIGLFPVVGVPLPFFSYGGTSMITSMIGVGILQSISMRRFMF
jgi:rod shape determining protein RodA